MVTAKDVLAEQVRSSTHVQRPDFGLVVGVDHYSDIRELRGAVADAKEFLAWMCDPEGGGVPPENALKVESCVNPPTPLQTQVDIALMNLLEQASKSGGGRRLYFHFSGHGAMNRAETGADVALLLAMWSAIFNRVALSSDGYRSELEGAGIFQEIAIFLDCCRSEAIGAVGVRPTFTTRSFSPLGPTKVFLAYATDPGAAAFEAPGADGWHGVFTKSLLSILRSSPSGMSAQALKYRLEEQLGMHNQRAHVVNGFEAHSTFGKRGQAPPLEVVFRRARGEVWLLDANNAIAAKHHTAAGTWKLSLEPGLYRLENPIAGDLVIDHRHGEASHVEF